MSVYVQATLKLGGQVDKVGNLVFMRVCGRPPFFHVHLFHGHGADFQTAGGAAMEATLETLATMIQQAEGRISTDQAMQLLIQIVALRASIKPIF